MRSIDTLYQISNKKYDDGSFDVLEMAQGLASLGVTPHHRRSFAPVRRAISAPS